MTAPKVRIYELSKALDVANKDVMDVLENEFGEKPKSHSSSIDQSLADKVLAHFKKNGVTPAAAESKSEKKPEKKDAPATAAPSEDAGESRFRFDPSRVVIRKRAADVRVEEEQKEESQSEPSKTVAPAAASGIQKIEPLKREAPKEVPVEPVAEAPVQEDKPKIEKIEPYKPKPVTETPAAQKRPGAPAAPGAPGTLTGLPIGAEVPRNMMARRPTDPGPLIKQAKQPRKTRRQIEAEKAAEIRRKREEEEAKIAATPKLVTIEHAVTVGELAQMLRLKDTELIKHLFMKGVMVTVNKTLDADYAKDVAREFDFEVVEPKKLTREEMAAEYGANIEGKALDAEKYKNLQPRSPVISIMGHVDHGKTTLLDAIRETRHKIVDTEAGGITQSIGAYSVEKNGQNIVFLDTPGHEAFTSMRMRGAQSTDIAILVVAADDGVMPQTIEAINHAKAAKIPIIVAVNKIDKADADPDKVLIQLADYGLNAEKWGGDTVTVEVSALQKLGLDDLLDMILLVSEILNLKADPTVEAEGVIVEALLDKRMGPVATALVQQGTLRVGDNVLIGAVGGRVRALINDHGERVQEAGPATPVEILGLSGVPNAGDGFRVIRDEKEFKQLLSAEKLRTREQKMAAVSRKVAATAMPTEGEGGDQVFNLVVKADTQGSLEAVMEVLEGMSSGEVKLNVLHSGTGNISEADVMLASTAGALLVGFNAGIEGNALKLAEQENTIIKTYDIIYRMTEDIEKWVLGQLSPEIEEVEAGSAEVRQIFKVGKTSVVAGCMVLSGKMLRSAKAVVVRDGQEVYSGLLDNLKRFRDDAKEVAAGYECGISFRSFNDLQEGDIITVYTVKELERTAF